jgi:starch synthase (maltosyl-transferring)
MRIYNPFPLLVGRFTDWPPHVEPAAEIGFDWISVNPVQRPGRPGSLYSIADYFELNPRLVHPTALPQNAEKQLRNAEKAVWEDLARFDPRGTSDPEGLYRYFYAIVIYLTDLGFSGCRCDVVYQIPGNLWQRLITEVKSRYPNVMFVAETLGCSPDNTRKTARSGFDYVFNSSNWWDFSSPWLLAQYDLIRETTRSTDFPESHDTDRLFHEMPGNLEAMKQRYLFSTQFSAGVMMPIGFEFGFKNRMHIVNTRPEDWEEPAINVHRNCVPTAAGRKMMRAFKDCPNQIVKIGSTRLTMVSLTMCLCLITAMFDDVLAAAKWTPHPLWPAQFAHLSITTRIVDEVLDIDQSHARGMLGNHVSFLRVIPPRGTCEILPRVSSAPSTWSS